MGEYYEVSEYTAEDFAQADLATKGEFGVARRTDPLLPRQWHACGYGKGWLSDEDMARDGWEPVVECEAHDRVVTLLDTKKALERTIEGLRHDLALAQEEIVDLRWENRRLEAGAEGVVSLDGLKAAWEAAERTGECSAGDVLIRKLDRDDYNVYRADAESRALSADVRILSRAPREPWADLADVLRTWDEEPMDADLMGRARWMHERGVRVTGGDDDE